jgi:tetratricopeptide (TPR) repeat protein
MLASTTTTTNAGGSINAGPVHCVENHDGALTVWRDAAVAHRVLVHVDAHHDLYGGWVDKKDPKERAKINIANFVYAALEEELVREVIWVVPDQTWATPAGRRDIVRELKSLDQGAGRKKKPVIQVEHDRIVGTVLGKRILACTVENLPALNEAVLLDIDIDYFVIPNVGYRGIEVYGSLPWCWPDQLLLKLQPRGVRTDLTTIAYSVEGDYTPLQWKYLGDELAQRLRPAAGDLAWTDRMRDAAQAAARGDFGAAETHYLAAHRLRPEFAAPCYHLAHMCAASGRLEPGREYLRQAYELDPSYRSPYNNAGWWYLEKRRHDQARSAFARALGLDPGDAYAHLGCGLLAIQEKKWPAAEVSLRRALALDDRCVEAWRALGQVLARRRARAEAVDAYERSLKLALSGRRALTNPVTLGQVHDWRTPWDPDHGVVLAELARLHVATHAWEKAITDYRMAIAAGGINASGAWTSLAVLYARLGRWRDGARASFQAVKRMPRVLTNWLGDLQVRCREAMDSWREARRPKRLGDAAPMLWI